MRSMEVNILKATIYHEVEENNCISIYKLGDNKTHSRKVSKITVKSHFLKALGLYNFERGFGWAYKQGAYIRVGL